MGEDWCPICGTRHRAGTRCRGEVLATGPERHAWRINVETPAGIEAYAVLIAPCGGVWRARILTYPNVLWLAPGGRTTLKFLAATPAEAEWQATEFVRDHCRSKNFTVREGPVLATPSRVPAESRDAAAPPGPARRKIRFLQVRFGVVQPSESGKTANLSETGLFILTQVPVEPGSPLTLSMETERDVIPLRGRVVWARKARRVGRDPGMGIQLIQPPSPYVQYVRSLP